MSLNKNNDWIWWLVIIILLCSATPLGLIALFVYLSRGNKSKQKQIPEKTGQKTAHTYTSDEVRTAVNDAMRTAGTAVDDAMRSVSDAINGALGAKAKPAGQKTQPASKSAAYTSAYVTPRRVEPVKPAAKKEHKPKKPYSRKAAKLKMIAGSVMAGIFTLGTISEFFECLADIWQGSMSQWEMLGEIIPLSVFACLSGVLALWGYFGLEKARRIERYQNLIQPERASLSVYALADALELKYNRVCDDLEDMIDRGYFEFAYLDRSKGRLILSPEFVNLYDAEPAARPVADAQPAADKATAEDNDMLRRIRAANDIIANAEMSAKLDEIESLTRKIFKLLEERPEKAESLHSFTAYYLPQTLKITEAYARLEAQGVEGDNITEAKEKITAALDMLVEGYRQQLDQLFADDVVDITADIAVMEQMLARDGLAGEELQPERKK